MTAGVRHSHDKLALCVHHGVHQNASTTVSFSKLAFPHHRSGAVQAGLHPNAGSALQRMQDEQLTLSSVRDLFYFMTNNGWHSRGYLPHFDAAGMVQHIVLCTANSVPIKALSVIKGETVSARRSRIDVALDQSQSGFVFNDQEAAYIMAHALKHFCGSRYDLLAWCVMPNHVHVVLVILPNHRLGQIVRSWKTFVTWEVNNRHKSEGSIFFKDYFDRYMRNGSQTERAIAYVENNPVVANLCNEPSLWRWSSAFERAKGWQPNVANLPLWLPK